MPGARSSAAPTHELVGSAWRGAIPQPAPSEPRAKRLRRDDSLRGGSVPRKLELTHPVRASARKQGAADLKAAQEAVGMSDEDLGAVFGQASDRGGEEATTGKLLVSYGELNELAPVPILLRVVCAGLARRITRDRAACFRVEDLVLVEHHVAALLALSTR